MKHLKPQGVKVNKIYNAVSEVYESENRDRKHLMQTLPSGAHLSTRLFKAKDGIPRRRSVGLKESDYSKFTMKDVVRIGNLRGSYAGEQLTRLLDAKQNRNMNKTIDPNAKMPCKFNVEIAKPAIVDHTADKIEEIEHDIE
jgi:hypothetical protein